MKCKPSLRWATNKLTCSSDMSCSSGRRDSLRKPQSYQTVLPEISVSEIGTNDQYKQIDDRSKGIIPGLEEPHVAMINEMVHFAALLRRISKEIYHNYKVVDILGRSSIAIELDFHLSGWKADLPEWLSLDSLSLRESEATSKQRLVLQLREFAPGRIIDL